MPILFCFLVIFVGVTRHQAALKRSQSAAPQPWNGGRGFCRCAVTSLPSCGTVSLCTRSSCGGVTPATRAGILCHGTGVGFYASMRYFLIFIYMPMIYRQSPPAVYKALVSPNTGPPPSNFFLLCCRPIVPCKQTKHHFAADSKWRGEKQARHSRAESSSTV